MNAGEGGGEVGTGTAGNLGSPRRDWAVFGVIALVLLAAAWFLPMDVILMTDPVAYMGGANGLVELGGYRYPEWLGNPRAGVYPPGNALLLSVPRALFGPQCDHPVAFGRWMALIGVASLAGVFQLLRQFRLPLPISATLILYMGVSMHWVWSLTHFWPDAAFVGVVCLAASLWMAGDAGKGGAWRWHWTGFLLGWALLLRPAALPFLGCAGLGALLQAWRDRRGAGGWRAPAAFLPWPLVAMAVWAATSIGSVSYADAVGDHWRTDVGGLSRAGRLWLNFRTVAGGAALVDNLLPFWLRGSGWLERTFPASGATLGWVRGLAHLALLLWVGRWVWRSGSGAWRIAFVALIGEGIAVSLAPFEVAARYALVAVPFAVAWTFRAAEAAWPGWSSTLRLAVASLLGLQVLASVTWTWETMEAEFRWAAGSRRAHDELSAYLARRVPEGAVIASGFQVDVCHLHVRTGRAFVMDYMVRAQPWGPVSHGQQGYIAANYLVLPAAQVIPAELEHVLARVMKPGDLGLALYAVDPVEERAWRRRFGYPPPGR